MGSFMLSSRVLRGSVLLLACLASVATTSPPTTAETRALALALDDPGGAQIVERRFRIELDGHPLRFTEGIEVDLRVEPWDAGSPPTIELVLPDGRHVTGIDGGFLPISDQSFIGGLFVPPCAVGSPCSMDLVLRVQGTSSPTPLPGPMATLVITQRFDSRSNVPPGTLSFFEVLSP